MSEKRHCYGIEYSDRFYDDPEEVIEDFLDYADEDLAFPHVLTMLEGEGQIKPLSHYLARCGLDAIFESAQETALDEVGDDDCTEGWLEQVTAEQRAELLALIDGWATTHGHQPHFWRIDVTRPVQVRILNADADYEWIGSEEGLR
jgi:hypothetical protein